MEDVEYGKDYAMSHAELSLFAATLAVFVRRDLSELAEQGITAADLSELEERQQAFADFPGDKELQAQIQEAGEKKDSARLVLEKCIHVAATHARRRFRTDSAILQLMDAQGLSQLLEAEFIAAARRIYHTAEEHASALAERGYTQEDLQQYKQAIEGYSAAISARDATLSARPAGTRSRLALGNDLYALCSFICNTAKRAYVRSNYAKYADYIIYKDTTPSTPPAVVQHLHYADAMVQWDAVERASSYTLYLRLSIEQDFTQVYSGEATHFSFVLPAPPVQGVQSYYFKVRARNAAGVGEFSEELNIPA